MAVVPVQYLESVLRIETLYFFSQCIHDHRVRWQMRIDFKAMLKRPDQCHLAKPLSLRLFMHGQLRQKQYWHRISGKLFD